MDLSPLRDQIVAERKEQGKPAPNMLLWQIDVMTFKGCQELALKARSLKGLDHALLTAGILSFKRKESPEGWETCHALIGLLLFRHLKSSPGNPNPPVVTFVTTCGIYPSSFTMGVPNTGSYLKKLSNNMDGMEQAHQYGRSKESLLYFTWELAARAAALETKATINSADPGSACTPLTNPSQYKLIPRRIMNFGARGPQICATALVNGVSAGVDSHGKIMQDFETASYLPFNAACQRSEDTEDCLGGNHGRV